MKLLIIAFIASSCAMNYIKPIKKVHRSKVSKIFAKYRNVLSEHDWEILQSDGAGGYLKATKPQYSLGMIVGIFVSNVSCSEYESSTSKCTVRLKRCNNTVPLSACSNMSEYTAKDETIQELMTDLKNIK